MARRRWLLLLIGAAVLAWLLAPEQVRIPVAGAGPGDWNPTSFWHEPWGRSGVHKGIDIFARKGTPVVAPTYGVVLYGGEIAPHFAHLDELSAAPGQIVGAGAALGKVGDSGNAKGKPPHLHYAVISVLPRPWRADGSSQGWKKMFYLDPGEFLAGGQRRL